MVGGGRVENFGEGETEGVDINVKEKEDYGMAEQGSGGRDSGIRRGLLQEKPMI